MRAYQNQPRGFVLLWTLALLMLAVVVLGGVVHQSASKATAAIQAQDQLQHKWVITASHTAVLEAAPFILEHADSRRRTSYGTVILALRLGGLALQMEVADEQAKVNLNTLYQQIGSQRTASAIRSLIVSSTSPPVFLQPDSRAAKRKQIPTSKPQNVAPPEPISKPDGFSPASPQANPRNTSYWPNSPGSPSNVPLPRPDGLLPPPPQANPRNAGRWPNSPPSPNNIPQPGSPDLNRKTTAPNGAPAENADSLIRYFATWAQVFDQADASTLLKISASRPSAITQLTCWGDGRLNLRDASPKAVNLVLGLCLEQAQIQRVLSNRTRYPDDSVKSWVQIADLTTKQREELSRCVTGRSHCYSVTFNINNGQRNWYEMAIYEQNPTVGSDDNEDLAATRPTTTAVANPQDSVSNKKTYRLYRLIW